MANLICSMSNNEDGIKMVRYAAQIENLCPQVINAARMWAARNTDIAKDNMKIFHPGLGKSDARLNRGRG